MPRVLPAFLMLAALAGGCSQDGILHVTWVFAGNEPAASGCGQHGVDSIVVSGVEAGGDGLRTLTLCTPGVRDVSVAPGTWTVQVVMLDAQAAPIIGANPDAPSPTGTAVVTTDRPGAVSVELDPPPSCSDGVDNDRDGRVDGADPDCQNGGTHE